MAPGVGIFLIFLFLCGFSGGFFCVIGDEGRADGCELLGILVEEADDVVAFGFAVFTELGFLLFAGTSLFAFPFGLFASVFGAFLGEIAHDLCLLVFNVCLLLGKMPYTFCAKKISIF